MLELAYQFIEEENYDDALSIYDKILQNEPNNISALIDKGVTLQNLGKFKKAIILFDKVIELSPKNIDAILNKGTCFHSQKKYMEAIDCYDQVLKLDKKCAFAFAYKGLSLGESGNLEYAIKYFKKALSIDKQFDLAIVSKQTAEELLKSKNKISLPSNEVDITLTSEKNSVGSSISICPLWYFTWTR